MLSIGIDTNGMAVTLFPSSCKTLSERISLAFIFWIADDVNLRKGIQYFRGFIGGAIIHHNDSIGVFKDAVQHFLQTAGIVIGGNQHTALTMFESFVFCVFVCVHYILTLIIFSNPVLVFSPPMHQDTKVHQETYIKIKQPDKNQIALVYNY
jgi:hypothetical protein